MMIMRLVFVIATSCLFCLSASLPTYAVKKYVTVPYDIIPSNGRIDQAVPFNVSGWTGTWALAGATAFTANFQQIWSYYSHQIEAVSLTAAISTNVATGSKIRFRVMHYNAASQQVWETLGPEYTQDPAVANPHALGGWVTDQVISWNGTFSRYIGAEVQGNGKLYMARVTVLYSVNDLTTEFNDLAARVSKLEQSGGGGSSLTLQGIADDIRARLAQ